MRIMLSTDYTITEFIVVFEATSLDEVADIDYWTDVDDVAKISQQELAEYGPYRDKARQRDKQAPSSTTTTTPIRKRRPSVRFDLTIQPPTKPNNFTPNSKDRSSLLQQLLLKPLKTIPEPNCNQIPRSPPVNGQTLTETNDSGQNNYDERQSFSSNKRTFLSAEEIALNRELLADLVPPDIDTIDLNSDKIYMSTLNDAESDSVSYVSSGNSDEDND